MTPHSLVLAAAPPVTESDTGSLLLQYIHEGGILSYILIGLSIIALTGVLYNLWEIRRGRQAPRRVMNHLEQLFREGRFREAEEYCRRGVTECFLTRLVAAALVRALSVSEDLSDFRSSIEAAGPAEVDRLHRKNDLFGIIAAVAPMLGLLGTVIGMIGAFRTIGQVVGAQRSTELATFMSMALVNTAEGLVVAIPCTVAFALFRRKIDGMVSWVGEELERLAALAKQASRRVPDPTTHETTAEMRLTAKV